MLIRLQKILARATSLSRRAAEEAIRKGLVRVNGAVITKLGTKADPDFDRITLSGKPIKFSRRKIYIAFNKPHGTITTKSDPQGRPTIWDRLPVEMKDALNSAGRLDFNSEGLLILTSDGGLIFNLTHPKSEIWKTYQVKVDGLINESAIMAIKNGVMLEDGVTKSARVKLLRKTGKNSYLEISIHEGRNRQVRRMFAKIGHSVIKLRRTAIGLIELGTLKPGLWRHLNRKELAYIRRLG